MGCRGEVSVAVLKSVLLMLPQAKKWYVEGDVFRADRGQVRARLRSIASAHPLIAFDSFRFTRPCLIKSTELWILTPAESRSRALSIRLQNAN
jgi:hypothetical protein